MLRGEQGGGVQVESGGETGGDVRGEVRDEGRPGGRGLQHHRLQCGPQDRRRRLAVPGDGHQHQLW